MRRYLAFLRAVAALLLGCAPGHQAFLIHDARYPPLTYGVALCLQLVAYAPALHVVGSQRSRRRRARRPYHLGYRLEWRLAGSGSSKWEAKGHTAAQESLHFGHRLSLSSVFTLFVSSFFGAIMENRTSFAIAHRLSTIIDVDLILAMGHSTIIEQGTHRELPAKDGAELYRSQFAYSKQTTTTRCKHLASGRVLFEPGTQRICACVL